ncbi:unnamed protein product [Cochlearia groenlandica]
MEGELFDWEVVHGSDTESTDSIASNKKPSSSSCVIDEGMILSDHFSADNLPDEQSLDCVVESIGSFRVDNGSDPQNRADLGFDFDEEKHVDGGIVSQYDDGSKCLSESDRSDVEEKLWSDDSGGNEHVSGDSGVVNGEDEIVIDSGVVSSEAIEGSCGNNSIVDARDIGSVMRSGEDEIDTDRGVVSNEAIEGSGGNNSVIEARDVDSVVRSGDDESRNRDIVWWWKMPFVVVKYCAFRIGPVWSVSMAAAVIGLVLLGRRLYNMKKKAQRFNLKVTIDDKKVLRAMSQAARLNEVFTEVRRVPVIRPALPSPVAWPVLSLR